jgi:hypothetical protein
VGYVRYIFRHVEIRDAPGASVRCEALYIAESTAAVADYVRRRLDCRRNVGAVTRALSDRGALKHVCWEVSGTRNMVKALCQGEALFLWICCFWAGFVGANRAVAVVQYDTVKR